MIDKIFLSELDSLRLSQENIGEKTTKILYSNLNIQTEDFGSLL